MYNFLGSFSFPSHRSFIGVLRILRQSFRSSVEANRDLYTELLTKLRIPFER